MISKWSPIIIKDQDNGHCLDSNQYSVKLFLFALKEKTETNIFFLSKPDLFEQSYPG